MIERGSHHQRPLPPMMQDHTIRSGLRLTLETTAGLPMSALALDQLPIHLRGGDVAHELLELLVAHTRMIAVGDSESESWQAIDADSLTPSGFADDQSLLPGEPRSFSGYRLLQEYFLLPEKFLSVNLSGLSSAVRSASGKRLEIVIGLDETNHALASRLSQDHLALHWRSGNQFVQASRGSCADL